MVGSTRIFPARKYFRPTRRFRGFPGPRVRLAIPLAHGIKPARSLLRFLIPLRWLSHRAVRDASVALSANWLNDATDLMA